MPNLKPLLNRINLILIYVLALALPLFFTTLTTEYFETGKLILVAVLVSIMFLVWGLQLLTENKLSIIKTPLDILLFFYLLIIVLSTVLSASPFTGLYGLLPKVQGSLISQVAVVLLFFMVVSTIRNIRQTVITTQLLIVSGLMMATVSLLSYFKIFLPFPAAQFTNFSLDGSPAESAVMLSILLPIALTALFNSTRTKLALASIPTVFYFLSSLVFVLTIVLIGNLAAWVTALFAAGLVIYLHLSSQEKKFTMNPTAGSMVGVIGVLAAVLAILSYTPTLKNTTILGQLSTNFNREIQLPLSTSWKISAGAFRDSPILGSGPATYLYDFTQYKPIEYNQNSFWNIRQNSAHDQYLEVWAELGGAGVLVLLLITLTFVFFALKTRDNWGLGVAGVTFFVSLALFPASFLVEAVGFFLLALFMVTSIGRNRVDEMTVDFSGRTSYGATSSHFLVPSLIFLPIIILVIAGFVYPGFIVRLTLGEYYNRVALNSISQNKALDGYNNLVKAESANPNVDAYRVNLAQTNFALANAIAAQKGPTETSPSGSLTDQDKTNLQQLLQQSIAEGRAAVTLAPKSAADWEVLATIYRQIAGVAQNALTFALDAYGHAIALDPFNPLLRLTVGGVYYQAKNYDLAVRFFDDTVSLKPDYPNGLYNLAIALRDKGNTQEAVTIAEQLVAQLQDKPASQDYKTASQLLNNLKSKTISAANNTQAPAATPSAALQNENLPKVLNLPKPSEVATPAAVTK